MPEPTFLFGGWEAIARVAVVGSLAYVALVVALRASGKRTLTRMSAFDFVITVAIGATFGRVLTARQVALAEAVTAFALLVALQYAVAWLQSRSPAVERLTRAAPTLLAYEGRVLHDALRRERLTERAILAAVRLRGLGALDRVHAVVLEADGRIAVIPRDAAGAADTLADVEGVH